MVLPKVLTEESVAVGFAESLKTGGVEPLEGAGPGEDDH
jgi:hypothetical protein